MNKTLLSIAALIGLTGASCSGNDDLVIRGVVDNRTAIAPFVGGSSKAMVTIDSVIAFPLMNAMINASDLPRTTTARLDANGAFALSLRPDRDYMLLLVDSTKSGVERYVGYVAASVAGGANTLLIPAAAATTRTIDVGHVSGTAEQRSTTNTLDAVALSLTPSALLDIARSDGALVNLRNLLVNWDGSHDYFQSSISFGFTMMNGAAPAMVPENTTPDPTAYAMRSDWDVVVDTNAPTVGIDQFCAPSTTPIELVSPVAITRSSLGATCTTPASGLRSGSSPDFVFAVQKNDAGAYGSHMSLSFEGFTGAPPAGDFVLRVAGTERARFDLESTLPVDPITLRPTTFVPVVRANTDATHRVVDLQIDWFASDGAGGYQPIADTSVLAHMLRLGEIKLAADDGSQIEGAQFDPVTTSRYVPTTPVYVSGGAAASHLGRVTIFTMSAGVSAFFDQSFQ